MVQMTSTVVLRKILRSTWKMSLERGCVMIICPRRIMCTGVVLVCFSLIVACGNGRAGSQSNYDAGQVDSVATSSDSSSGDPYEYEWGTETSTPMTMATSTASTALDITFTDSGRVWNFSNALGYSYDMKIAVGDPLRDVNGKSSPGNGAYTIGSACDIDPKTDVVIPVRWIMTATTSGYDTPITVRAALRPTETGYTGAGVTPKRTDSRVRIEQYFSSGPDCNSSGSEGWYGEGSWSVKWDEPTSEGESRISYFLIIIKDYYTPATPDGDTSLLSAIAITPLPGGDISDQSNVYKTPDTSGMLITGDKTGCDLTGQAVATASEF